MVVSPSKTAFISIWIIAQNHRIVKTNRLKKAYFMIIQSICTGASGRTLKRVGKLICVLPFDMLCEAIKKPNG